MSKTSKRAITLFVIATMVLSMLSAFIAVPVMAETTYTCGFQIQAPGAEVYLSTEQKHDGIWSVKQVITGGTANTDARVKFNYNEILDSLTSVDFWAYLQAQENPSDVGPYVTMSLDTTGNGEADFWIVQGSQFYEIGVWEGTHGLDGATQVAVTESQIGGMSWEEPYNTFNNLKIATVGGMEPKTYGECTVLEIKVGIGTWGPDYDTTAFVDGVTINSVTYDFEELIGEPVEETVSAGTGTIKSVDAETIVDYDASDECTITIENLAENEVASATFWALGEYVDVKVDDPEAVTSLDIRVYYDDPYPGLDEVEEALLKMYWYDETNWAECSETGANEGENYVWATITEDTSPSLSDMTGTPFGPGTGITAGEDFSIDFVTEGDVDYGKTMLVQGSGVTSGSAVNIYWDFVKAGSLLNSTTGLPSGDFECTVKVPSAYFGNHYIWAKDLATGISTSWGPIPVISKITLSPSSGLLNDDITIKGYGFAADSEITFTYEEIIDILSDDTGKEETDDLGYFEYTFEVDTDKDEDYLVTAKDEDDNNAEVTFKLGAAISLDIDEGPTGTIVTVDGRGWANGDIMTFRDKANPSTVIEVVDGDTITVGSNGRFSAEVVIPKFGNEGDYDIEAYGSISKSTSSDGFELTGLPEIVVTPTYGTPGSIITVTGTNFTQIAGTEVTIILDSTDLVVAKTDSDGTFEDTFMSPAVVFTTYDVEATDEYSLVATDAFKVGLIALIINPVYGEAGTNLFITGIGFADGDYNLTFGIKLYEDFSTVDKDAISDYFFVPNVPTGPYDIIISDEDGNEMTKEFRVTAVTEVTLDPASAPNKYNVTIEGCNFADKEFEDVEFVLYNATEEWAMNVWQDKEGTDRVETCDDGNFTAWWEVLEDDTLSLGDYTINVTGYDDFFVQMPFSVVEAQVDVAPRKELFDRGDTIQFNVKNDFDFKESYMKIWDPDDNLYWETGLFVDWVKSGDLYTVPYYMQTSGGNPMELTQDAPVGTWVYVFYETGTTQLTNGTFEVGPSAESLLTEQITALSEELGIDIDTLRTVIDDLGIDMDDAVSTMAADIAAAVSSMEDDFDDAVTGMQDDISGLSDDIDGMGTKMDSIETMVDDISETSGDAQQAANDAKTSADQATEAALQNQRQTSGLTGLVYGAIGASLIAALAAIVSLMQISKRIAG